MQTSKRFVERIQGDDYFVMDQWQLEELAKVRRKAQVTMVSDGLPAEMLDALFVESAPSVEEAVEEALRAVRSRRADRRHSQRAVRAGAGRLILQR